jgi:hypothetical protein
VFKLTIDCVGNMEKKWEDCRDIEMGSGAT